MKKTKIMIADDHQLIIEGFKALLSNEENIEIIDEATDGRQVLEKLKKNEVDIIFLDIEMPLMNGYEVAEKVRAAYPDVKIIALSAFDEKNIIARMISAGVSGYLLKNLSREELVDAIETVNKGLKYFSKELPAAFFSDSKAEKKSNGQRPPLSCLSGREFEILKLIAQGMSNTEIAKQLFISSRTVDTHRNNLMQKIKVKNIAGLIRYAIESRII